MAEENYKFNPLTDKLPLDIWTFSDRETQMWQELMMMRHLDGPLEPLNKEEAASYIQQARTYFVDAKKSNWRSSGLLYYYCFLNLAKAHLLSSEIVTVDQLKNEQLFHGLRSDTQKLNSILDFTLEIQPKKGYKGKNVFACIYEAISGEEWPFTSKVTVSMADLLPYCTDISHECVTFYGLNRACVEVLSMMRYDRKKVWVEHLVRSVEAEKIQRVFDKRLLSSFSGSSITESDKAAWKNLYHIDNAFAYDSTLIRCFESTCHPGKLLDAHKSVSSIASESLRRYAVPLPLHDMGVSNYWYFVPEISINGKMLAWHPLFSDYLISFIFSTILRYHPYLLVDGSKDAFLSEAWVNQCPAIMLRYFLMEMTKQNLRLN